MYTKEQLVDTSSVLEFSLFNKRVERVKRDNRSINWTITIPYLSGNSDIYLVIVEQSSRLIKMKTSTEFYTNLAKSYNEMIELVDSVDNKKDLVASDGLKKSVESLMTKLGGTYLHDVVIAVGDMRTTYLLSANRIVGKSSDNIDFEYPSIKCSSKNTKTYYPENAKFHKPDESKVSADPETKTISTVLYATYQMKDNQITTVKGKDGKFVPSVVLRTTTNENIVKVPVNGKTYLVDSKGLTSNKWLDKAKLDNVVNGVNTEDVSLFSPLSTLDPNPNQQTLFLAAIRLSLDPKPPKSNPNTLKPISALIFYPSSKVDLLKEELQSKIAEVFGLPPPSITVFNK